jgi:glucose/arabinose dehydrogenase
VPPKLNFDAHSAALGVNFYTHDSFPEKYHGGMFVAHRGSWNRTQKIGYRVMYVKINGDKVEENEVFAEGWLQGQ